MANNVREYQFITGPETATKPTSGTPTEDTDFMTKGYADVSYMQGRASVSDVTALKAVGSSSRTDGMACAVQSSNAIYIFDAGSSETGDDFTVITPTAGTGRWILATGSSSGSSGINYIEQGDAEGSITDWATYADAAGSTPIDGDGASASVTWTTNSTTPLRGTADFKLEKDAVNRQGQGVAYDFTVDRADLNKTLWLSFDVDATDANYSAGDLAVYLIKDIGGTPTLVTPSYTDIAGAKYKFEASFSCDSNTDWRLCIHTATTNATAWTGIYFDNFKVGPEEVIQTTPIEDGVTVDITEANFSNATGLTITGTFTHKRVSSDLLVDLNMYLTGTGTDAADLTFNLSSISGLENVTIPAGNYGAGQFSVYHATSTSRYAQAGLFRSAGTDALAFISLASGVSPYDGTAFGSGASGNFHYVTVPATLPVNQWAGSSVGLSNSRVQFASNSSTATAANDTTSFAYGPSGSKIQAITNDLQRTVRFLTPIQPTDILKLQVSRDGIRWMDASSSMGGMIDSFRYDGTYYFGMGFSDVGTLADTDVNVLFGNYRTGTNTDWSTMANYYWRVSKSSNPLSIGEGTLKDQVQTTTTDLTISTQDRIGTVFVTTGASNITVTLPSASSNLGRKIIIKKVDSGAGVVAVDGEGAETVDGESNLDLQFQYDSLTVASNGTSWSVVGAKYGDYRYYEFTADGDFTGGTVKVARVGRIVTVTCGVLTHSSAAVVTDGAAIPTWGRPTVAVRCVGSALASSVTTLLSIETAGNLNFRYYSTNGATTTRTDTLYGATISYVV